MTVMPCGNCGEYVKDNIVGTKCDNCGWKVGDGIAGVVTFTYIRPIGENTMNELIREVEEALRRIPDGADWYAAGDAVMSRKDSVYAVAECFGSCTEQVARAAFFAAAPSLLGRLKAALEEEEKELRNLGRVCDRWAEESDRLKAALTASQQREAKYREALEFYADRTNWGWRAEGGEVARTALQEEGGEG